MALTFEDVQNSGLMGDQSGQGQAFPAAQSLLPNQPPSASAPPYTPPATTFGSNPAMGDAMRKAGFGTQLAKKMDQNPAPPSPDGWAKSILASAQQVLAGVGDMSTTPTTQPESKAGSFFEGLAQTTKNRNEREQNQKQQEFENQRKMEAEKQSQQRIDVEKQQSDSVIAHNNVENMHTLRLIHDMGTDQVDKQIARDAVQVNEYKEDDPTSEIYSDMSKEDIYKKMEELQAKDPHDPNHPLVLHPFITRQVDTGKKDSDGNPIMDTKYSLFREPEKRKLGDTVSKLANQYGLQGPGGTEFSPDDELFGHQINTLTKNITMAQTAEDAVNKLAANALTDKEAKEVQETIADQKFDGDWIKILDAAKKNSTGEVNPNSVLMVATNGVKDSKGNVVVPPVKNANDVVAEKFGGRPQFDKMLDYQNKIDVEAERERVKQAELGDMSSLASSMVEGNLDPTQASKRASSYNALLEAANQYSQATYGVPFDFAKASRDYKFATTPATINTMNFLNSLTGPDNKSGNLGKLVDMSNQISRTSFPALNDAAAWAKIETGSPQIAAYKVATLEVADQVAKVLQGGGTGNATSDAKLNQAAEMFRVGFNKDQMRDVASTLRDLLGNRKAEMIGDNRYMQRWQQTYADKYTQEHEQTFRQNNSGRPSDAQGTKVFNGKTYWVKQMPNGKLQNLGEVTDPTAVSQPPTQNAATSQQISNMAQVAAKAALDAQHKAQTHGAK